MTKSEAITFIEKMAKIGDEWTIDQVMDVYGGTDLQSALDDRMATNGHLFDIIGKIINR